MNGRKQGEKKHRLETRQSAKHKHTHAGRARRQSNLHILPHITVHESVFAHDSSLPPSRSYVSTQIQTQTRTHTRFEIQLIRCSRYNTGYPEGNGQPSACFEFPQDLFQIYSPLENTYRVSFSLFAT